MLESINLPALKRVGTLKLTIGGATGSNPNTVITNLDCFENLESAESVYIEKQMGLARPDSIEILPGLMPKVIRRVARLVKAPVIAGGLISEKEDVMAALSAGAISVSSTNQSVWSV